MLAYDPGSGPNTKPVAEPVKRLSHDFLKTTLLHGSAASIEGVAPETILSLLLRSFREVRFFALSLRMPLIAVSRTAELRFCGMFGPEALAAELTGYESGLPTGSIRNANNSLIQITAGKCSLAFVARYANRVVVSDCRHAIWSHSAGLAIYSEATRCNPALDRTPPYIELLRSLGDQITFLWRTVSHGQPLAHQFLPSV